MKIVKRIVTVVLAVVVLAAVAVVARFYVLAPKLRPAPEVKAQATPEAIERGRYLATNVMGCVGCHSEGRLDEPGDPMVPGRLGSGRDFPIANFPGHVRSSNLTPSKEHGLGAWTDGEIVRALREGVDRNGRALFGMMPYKTYAETMSDDDALAIVAYLRTLAPIEADHGLSQIDFPIAMFVRAGPKPLEAPPPSPPTEPLARGQWILRVASCAECHSPMEHGAIVEGKRFAGGRNPFPVRGGKLFAPNITSDKATGIGAYSDADILRAFNEGIGKSGKPLYIMPWPLYRGMTDADKQALLVAIRAIPPVANVVEASTVPR